MVEMFCYETKNVKTYSMQFAKSNCIVGSPVGKAGSLVGKLVGTPVGVLLNPLAQYTNEFSSK